mgnify:CR=1 FL=1
MIYCVEDERNIRELLIYTLETTGFKARGFGNGNELMKALKEEIPELILLDIMLPGDDGYTILEQLKSMPSVKDVPVIMVTAKEAEFDKVKGLEGGADDYITKPFEPTELVARVEAVLRRCGKAQGTLAAFDVVLDPAARRVTRGSTPLHLTPREFDLLEVLLRNRGIVLYREVLYERVWGLDAEYDSRTLDLHIQRLRKKLGWKNEIRTVFRVGYVLERRE